MARTWARMSITPERLARRVRRRCITFRRWRVRFTRQSKKITRNQLSEGKDPKGRNYYWIFEQKIDKDIEPDTDYAAVFAGDVSITPLHLDPTDTESLTSLAHWAEQMAELSRK